MILQIVCVRVAFFFSWSTCVGPQKKEEIKKEKKTTIKSTPEKERKREREREKKERRNKWKKDKEKREFCATDALPSQFNHVLQCPIIVHTLVHLIKVIFGFRAQI